MRVRLRFLLVFALGTLAAAVWLLSTPALDPKRLMVGEFGQERPFKSKPARELIAKNDLAAYEKALAAYDCTTAHRLLNGAFIRAHPEFRRAKWQPECGLKLSMSMRPAKF